MAVFFREERAHLETKMEQQEAKMEQQRQEMEQQRQDNTTKLREQVLLRELTQIAALQLRVQSLHAAQLLADEELYGLEDIIVDGCEVELADGGAGDGRVAKMVALSERVAADGAFARQLRRKFV